MYLRARNLSSLWFRCRDVYFEFASIQVGKLVSCSFTLTSETSTAGVLYFVEGVLFEELLNDI